MTAPVLGAISPSFVSGDVAAAVAFYCDMLGYELRFADPDAPWFAIVGRDSAQIFLKSEGGVVPQPNRMRHAHLRLDAFVHVADPDALAAEYAGRGVVLASPLQDTHDGLRGFEVDDADGYRLFFGRPR